MANTNLSYTCIHSLHHLLCSIFVDKFLSLWWQNNWVSTNYTKNFGQKNVRKSPHSSSRNLAACTGDRRQQLRKLQPRIPRAILLRQLDASVVLECQWVWTCRRIWMEKCCVGGLLLLPLWRTPLLLWCSSMYPGSSQMDPACTHPTQVHNSCYNHFLFSFSMFMWP